MRILVMDARSTEKASFTSLEGMLRYIERCLAEGTSLPQTQPGETSAEGRGR